MMSPEEYMLPCLWKKMFGIDCLGCGTQRALSLIFQGDFVGAFKMYPAIYTIIIMFTILVLHLKFKFKNGSKILFNLFILNIIIIVTSYIIKHI
ncbi:DUF2752 domain-containing protein [Winogradskyella sp. 3972H.M.0a.05]|uniref:DUF2752 domain-containing protein n=1 Tax=Winogradskyella sp. 3972H.M.0a.05 TaxID=2950277 RepID=UPI003397A996